MTRALPLKIPSLFLFLLFVIGLILLQVLSASFPGLAQPFGDLGFNASFSLGPYLCFGDGAIAVYPLVNQIIVGTPCGSFDGAATIGGLLVFSHDPSSFPTLANFQSIQNLTVLPGLSNGFKHRCS